MGKRRRRPRKAAGNRRIRPPKVWPSPRPRCTARRVGLRFAKTSFRLDWLYEAMTTLEARAPPSRRACAWPPHDAPPVLNLKMTPISQDHGLVRGLGSLSLIALCGRQCGIYCVSVFILWVISMKLAEAAIALQDQDSHGVLAFSRADLGVLFPHDNDAAFTSGLNRLLKARFLMRAARGVYVNMLSNNQANRLEAVAKCLREGCVNYISLESALSQQGVISQIPMRLTVMTTGRKGTFHTPFGVIEFTHTSRPLMDVCEDIHWGDYPLPMAGKHKAYRDLVRVGRNVGMVDMDELGSDD